MSSATTSYWWREIAPLLPPTVLLCGYIGFAQYYFPAYSGFAMSLPTGIIMAGFLLLVHRQRSQAMASKHDDLADVRRRVAARASAVLVLGGIVTEWYGVWVNNTGLVLAGMALGLAATAGLYHAETGSLDPLLRRARRILGPLATESRVYFAGAVITALFTFSFVMVHLWEQGPTADTPWSLLMACALCTGTVIGTVITHRERQRADTTSECTCPAEKGCVCQPQPDADAGTGAQITVAGSYAYMVLLSGVQCPTNVHS
ncbi:hypothetical protein Q8F55_005615 [Vanrija albida]|uniref:Uncharacterized protein n=1 Tax=Vanrija albida TaxID=181172 RepID=A0ABR3Q2C2_9TREE